MRAKAGTEQKQVFLFEMGNYNGVKERERSKGEKKDPTIICETQAREAIAEEPEAEHGSVLRKKEFKLKRA